MGHDGVVPDRGGGRTWRAGRRSGTRSARRLQDAQRRDGRGRARPLPPLPRGRRAHAAPGCARTGSRSRGRACCRAGRSAPRPTACFHAELLDALPPRGTTPLVTLYHGDPPQALEDEYGGWLDRRVVDDFVAHAALAFDAFGGRVKDWITLNEPRCSAAPATPTAATPGAAARRTPSRTSRATTCAARARARGRGGPPLRWLTAAAASPSRSTWTGASRARRARPTPTPRAARSTSSSVVRRARLLRRLPRVDEALRRAASASRGGVGAAARLERLLRSQPLFDRLLVGAAGRGRRGRDDLDVARRAVGRLLRRLGRRPDGRQELGAHRHGLARRAVGPRRAARVHPAQVRARGRHPHHRERPRRARRARARPRRRAAPPPPVAAEPTRRRRGGRCRRRAAAPLEDAFRVEYFQSPAATHRAIRKAPTCARTCVVVPRQL